MSKIYTEVSEMTPGWYMLGIENEVGEIDWGGAQFLHYLGNGCFMSESGDEVTSAYDPVIEAYVSIDAFKFMAVN